MSTGSVHIVHKELSYAVVGCAQRVHAALGPGFPEGVYENAVCVELAEAGIPFRPQASYELRYKDVLCGSFRVDVAVDEKIILELKAVEALAPQHSAQLLAYLKASGLRLGLLMNFGETRLRVERVVH